MASSHFDNLTRSLAASTSRRQTLKAIFVGALGGALGLSGLSTALARADCSSKGSICHSNSECCSQDCYKGKCNCKPKGAVCNFIDGRDCCSGNCQVSSVAPNWYCG